MVSKFSGFFNNVINGIFRGLVDKDAKNELKAALSGTDNKEIGKKFAIIFKKFMYNQVPGYQYRDFCNSDSAWSHYGYELPNFKI